MFAASGRTSRHQGAVASIETRLARFPTRSDFDRGHLLSYDIRDTTIVTSRWSAR